MPALSRTQPSAAVISVRENRNVTNGPGRARSRGLTAPALAVPAGSLPPVMVTCPAGLSAPPAGTADRPAANGCARPLPAAADISAAAVAAAAANASQ
jgi:hypothetical protein